MIAAHSLGSVVVHNHLVRKWTSGVDVDCVHDRLVTFGSPIGIITWLWLFLDFPGLVFNAAEPTGTNYFCQSPSSNAGKNAKRLLWVNVANALDPIATAFPSAAADLSRPVEEVVASLAGGQVHHRFLGRVTATHAGVAHTAYLHDRRGFIEILLRAADLRDDDPLGVESVLPSRHWAGSRTALARLRVALWVAAFASALAYCAVVASHTRIAGSWPWRWCSSRRG